MAGDSSSDTPTTSTATATATAQPAGDTRQRGDSVEAGAIFIGLLAAIVLVACAILIQVDKQWDEARRCLVAGHKAMLAEFRQHKARWQEDHDANVRSAEEELKRLQDRKAPQTEIAAAQQRLDQLRDKSYQQPESANDVSFNIDGSPVLLSLKVDVGELTWFRKGDFVFHEYQPEPGDTRADEFGRYWYIEVLIEEPAETGPAGENAGNEGASPATPSNVAAPPAGRARIYADGSLAGPFSASRPVPDGHPVLESPAPPSTNAAGPGR